MKKRAQVQDRDSREIPTSKENPLRDAPTPMVRAEQVLAELETIPQLYRDCLELVANGGSLIQCADKLGVPYSRLSVWINEDENRREQFKAAVAARDEWIVARIMDELQAIGLCDVKQLFKEDGTMKALKDIPDAVARCISSIEVEEANDFHGRIKKVRMIDKIRGIEVLIKGLQGFVEKKELKIEHTYKIEEFDLTDRLKMYNIPIEKSQSDPLPIEIKNEGVSI